MIQSRKELVGLAGFAVGGVAFVFGLFLVRQQAPELVDPVLTVVGAALLIVSAGFLLVLYKTTEIIGDVPCPPSAGALGTANPRVG